MPRPIRFAAAGDIHADDANRDDLARAFRDVDGTVLPLTLYHSGRARGGSVRGLLCRACTTALVFLRDSPVLLARAMAFLTAAMDEGPLVTARAEVQH